MDIDPDIANWVLEYLLGQPLEDRTLNSLLRALPLPNNNPNLWKSLLLKKLESQAWGNSISETSLELLEQLEEIEFRRGNRTVSNAMKRAYCAVAVECTLKHLKTGDYEFFEAAKRLWRGRIGRMLVEKGGLCSEELQGWKDEIETAVWEDSVRESVVKRSESLNAVEAVNTYVREDRQRMGPSFLELVAAKLKDDEVILRGIFGVGAGKDCHVAGIGKQKGKIHLRDKLVGLRRAKGLTSRRGAKIAEDSYEMETESYRHYNLLSSTEVKKVREALGTSSLDLQAVVEDPLPDALEFAETLSSVAGKSKHSVEENHVEPNLFIVDGEGVVQGFKRPRPSLMERNGSSHTCEWDDSIDGSQQDPTCRRPISLPSPRLINVSPLKRCENQNLKRRRKGRKWTNLEEDTLRAGVEKFGKGNWKVILMANGDIFEGRTEVDLKDKWRNLTRY